MKHNIGSICRNLLLCDVILHLLLFYKGKSYILAIVNVCSSFSQNFDTVPQMVSEIWLKTYTKMALFRCYAIALRILSLFLIIQLLQSFNMCKWCICNCFKKDQGLFWSLVCWNRITIVDVINKTVNVVVCYVNFILDFSCLLWATKP
jgi:hypothetical protein